MIVYLQGITQQRASWMLLLVSALFLEICAMVFQHGLGLLPCVMCIYERIATIGLIAAALVALLNPKRAVFRWLGILIWGYCSIRGLQLSLQHVDYLLNPAPFNTCSIFPDFPGWLPLDSWVPFFFAAYADCAEKQWQFLGWELPQWLVPIFALYLAIWLVIVIANLIRKEA
ncbi:disulfide bond formation protein DsbB [Serratia fonticola]|uniref:disulfide bond formation protein DsbB n=1 Tax=Serratia fonticola TaxID=47917 RepID=UPI003BB5DEC6